MFGSRPARGEHAARVRELGATPIDYKREDFTRVLPGGFDIVFDGIGEDGYRRSFAALKRGGLAIAVTRLDKRWLRRSARRSDHVRTKLGTRLPP